MLNGSEKVLSLPEYSPNNYIFYDNETKRQIAEMMEQGLNLDEIAEALALDIDRLRRYCGKKITKSPEVLNVPKELMSDEDIIAAAIKDKEGGVSAMTDMQKEAIRQLRLDGLGYKAIADKLMLKRETVVSHCRRHGLTARELNEGKAISETGVTRAYCRCCGKEIEQKSKQKPRKFCSEECRSHWWNTHLYLVEQKAFYDITCKRCGTVFRSYGNRNRKYCYYDCYIKNRFGE